MNTTYSKIIASTFSIVMIIAPSYSVAERIDCSLDIFRTNNEHLKEIKITDSSKKVLNVPTVAFEISASTTIACTSAPPRTELGRKLLEFRKKAISKGMPLLSIDEVNLRVKESRGNEA